MRTNGLFYPEFEKKFPIYRLENENWSKEVQEEVILVAKPEIILVAKYSGGKTSLKYLIAPPAHNQLYMCRGKKKKYFLRVLIILSLP